MSFKNILAQPLALETLKKALKSGRLSGAYLFHGPEGVGKRLTAREVAKAINCEAREEEACDRCLSCRKTEEGHHPDLFWVEPEGETAQLSIEAIRQLKRELGFRPWEGRRRVVVLPEAERATDEAQNAFLKMLEETPPGSLILLTSVQVEKILPTVLSRCKRIRFGPIPSETIQKVLEERRGLSRREAASLARFCHGSLGKALSMKEEVLERKEEILAHFLEKAFAIDEEREAFREKEGVLETLDLLTSWYRDLWMVKEGAPQTLLFHEDRVRSLQSEISLWEGSALEEALRELLDSRERLDQHVNMKLLLPLLARRLKELRGQPA